MPHKPAPTPQELGDALAVIAMGGDAQDLACACRISAGDFDGEGRRRLLRAAAALDAAAAIHTAMVAGLD